MSCVTPASLYLVSSEQSASRLSWGSQRPPLAGCGELTRDGGEGAIITRLMLSGSDLTGNVFFPLQYYSSAGLTTHINCVAKMQVRSGRIVSLARVSAVAFPWHTPVGTLGIYWPAGPAVSSLRKSKTVNKKKTEGLCRPETASC